MRCLPQLLALVICTNSNICGKAHFGMDQQGTNTGKGAYGYAFRAIECLRVLGPPNLDILPGTCFIRCNKGVNAKLMVRDGCRRTAVHTVLSTLPTGAKTAELH